MIRLSDGKVTEVPDRVELAYFTPGCGAGDEVAFTSSSATDTSAGSTTVISVDAASGSVSSRRTIDGCLTHVTPTQRGTVGVLAGNLVDLKANGKSGSNSSTENLRYSLGSSEPELQSKYDHGPCIDHPSVYSNAIIVDDLGEHEDTYGCGDFEAYEDGKFTLQVGDNITVQRDDSSYRATPYIANIDLHQLGAGYDHHVYFTHSYDYGKVFHQVTGRWQVNPASLPSGDQPGERYKVYVHLPGHGAEATVRYDFIPGDNTAGAKADYCNVNQGTRSAGGETWFEMGTFSFWKGGRIEMDNIQKGGTGDDNVVFDAIAFVPFLNADPGACALVDGGL